MNTPIFCLLLQICIVSTHAQALNRASYGENCSKDLRCEFRNVLTCANGVCECMMPDTMVFEEVSGNCVTLAGERCQYNSVEGETTWMEEVPCISNALCRNGICECDKVHYEIANGSCLPKLDYGNDCLSDKMCNGQKHLICGVGKKCICSNNRVLSNEICIVLAGQFCLPNDTCTENSICSASQGTPMCTCFHNYYQEKNMTCQLQKNYGETCDGHDHCIASVQTSQGFDLQTFLVCAKGKCQCDERKSVFDISRTCKKYWGQLCDSDEECIAGATCAGTCQCKTDFYEEVTNKTCQLKKSFGEFCEWDAHCQNNLQCNPEVNTCACKHGNEFHPDKKQCVVSAGHICNENIYSSTSFSKACVPHANCGSIKYFDNELSTYTYKCTCNGDTKKSMGSGGYCYIKENGACDGDTINTIRLNTCLPGLLCRDSVCVCPYKGHHIFNRTIERCISYVGAPCDTTADCLDENAECSSETGIKQCKCKKRFTQVGRTCDRAYGERCKFGDNKPKCDQYGPLECSPREICECSELQIYDKKTLRCKGLVGAICTPGVLESGNFCIHGATCQRFRGFQETLGLCTCNDGWKTEANRTCSAPVLQVRTVDTLQNILV